MIDWEGDENLIDEGHHACQQELDGCYLLRGECVAQHVELVGQALVQQCELHFALAVEEPEEVGVCEV